MIYANYYMLIRNEDKFMYRNKSRRQHFATRILRESVVAMMMGARDQLAFFHPSKTLFDLKTLQETTTASETTVFLKEGEWSIDRDDSAVYLEGDVRTKKSSHGQIDGLGKNLLTERSRKKGVRAYSLVIRLYLLRVRMEVMHYAQRLFQLIKDVLATMDDETMSYEPLFKLPQWEGLKT